MPVLLQERGLALLAVVRKRELEPRLGSGLGCEMSTVPPEALLSLFVIGERRIRLALSCAWHREASWTFRLVGLGKHLQRGGSNHQQLEHCSDVSLVVRALRHCGREAVLLLAFLSTYVSHFVA